MFNREYDYRLACVASRFWLSALSNKGGRGQKNREEIGAEATCFYFSCGFAARSRAFRARISRLRRSCARLDKTAMLRRLITDRIGFHSVLLPINHNFNKICDILASSFFNQNTRNSKIFFASSKKKSHLSARVMARTVQLLSHDAYCPI